MVLSFNIRCNFVFQVIYPNVHKAFPKISDSHALPERANLKKTDLDPGGSFVLRPLHGKQCVVPPRPHRAATGRAGCASKPPEF
jgi:hypothetical protein